MLIVYTEEPLTYTDLSDLLLAELADSGVAGYKIFHVNNLAQCVALVNLDPLAPEAIALYPRKEDTELQDLEILRSKFPGIPILVVPGNDGQLGLSALEKGAYAFHLAPLDGHDFASMIQSIRQQRIFFKQLMEQAQEILKPDAMIVWQQDQEHHCYRIASSQGEIQANYLSAELNLDEGRGDYFSSGKAVYISDVADRRRWPRLAFSDKLLAQGYLSMVSIPLYCSGVLLGFFDCLFAEWNTKDSKLIKKLLPILEMFSKQAALTLRLVNHQTRMRVVQQLTKVLDEDHSGIRLIRQILYRGLRLLGAPMGGLYLFDSTDHLLKLQNSLVLGKPPPEVLDPKDLETVMLFGHPLICKDAQKKTVFPELEHENSRSWVMVPLRQNDHKFGVLLAQSPRPHAFSDEDISLLLHLANKGAAAIANGKLARYIEEVSDLALKADMTQLTQVVVNALKDLTGADVILWLPDREQRLYLRAKAFSDQRTKVMDIPLIPKDPTQSISGKAMATGEAIRIPDINHQKECPAFFMLEQVKHFNWHSLMAVPLLCKDKRCLGVLNLYWKRVKNISQAESDLIIAFTRKITLSIQFRDSAEQLEYLTQVGQKLTELFDNEEKLFQAILQAGLDLFSPKNAVAIMLNPHDSSGTIHRRILRGKLEGPDIDDLLYREKGLCSAIIEQGSLMITDLGKRQGLFLTGEPLSETLYQLIADEEFVVREKIQAFLAIRLFSPNAKGKETRTHGIMFFNFEKATTFSEEERHILDIFREQVNQALHTSCLHLRSKRQAEELEIIGGTATHVLGKVKLEHVLDELICQAKNLLEASGGEVYLVSPDLEELRLVAAEPKLKPLNSVLAFGKGMAGITAQTKKRCDTNNYPNSIYMEPEYRDHMTVVVDVPLMFEGECIGVVSIFDKSPARILTVQDISRLEGLATHATLAIVHAQVLEESEGRNKALERLQTTLVATAGIKGRRLPHFTELIAPILKEAASLISMKSQNGLGAGYLVCNHRAKLALNVSSRNQNFIGVVVPLDNFLPGEVIRTGEPQTVNDFPESPLCAPIYKQLELTKYIKNVILVPVRDLDKVIGLLAVSDSSGKKRFSKKDKEILKSYANLVAVAINMWNSARTTSTINELLRVFSEKQDRGAQAWMEDVLNILMNTFNCTHCTILVPHEAGNTSELNAPGAKADIGLRQKVFVTGESEIVANAGEHELFSRPDEDNLPLSLMVTPVKVHERILGTITMEMTGVEGHFGESEVLLMELLADYIGRAYEADQTPYLIQTEKMVSLGYLVSGIAHEINNPLQVLRNSSEVLKRATGKLSDALTAYQADPANSVSTIAPTFDKDNLEKHKGSISNSLDRGERAIGNIAGRVKKMLEYTRGKSNQQPDKPFDVKEQINSTLGLFAYLLKGIQVNQDRVTSFQLRKINSVTLDQVLTILLVNATQAMEDSTKIKKNLTISADVLQKGICISIKDNGPGIKQEDLPKIFERYFTTKGKNGTGIGLELARWMIRKENGDLVVESTFGEGATFTITLPSDYFFDPNKEEPHE